MNGGEPAAAPSRIRSALAPTPFGVFVGLLTVASVAHVLVRTSTYGGAMGGDAVSYMSTAANLVDGHGLQDFRGATLFAWPPLFPVLTAAVGALGLDSLTASRILNAMALGCVVLVSGFWLRRAVSSAALAAAAATVLATSYPLAFHASHLNSELTFILFVLLALVALGRCLQHGESRPALAAAIFCSMLAVMTRYAGVALVLSGALVLLGQARLRPRERLVRALVYAVASVLPLVAWTARNWLFFGQWKRSGPNLGAYAPADLLAQLFQAPARAILPWDAPGWAVWIPWAAALFLAFACIRAAVLKSRRGEDVSDAAPAWPFGAFAVVYLLFLLLTVSRFSDLGLDQRFLLVAYVPFVLCGTCLFDRFLLAEARSRSARAGRVSEGLVVLFCVLGIVLGIRDNFHTTRAALREGFYGRSYNVASWDESETVRFLKTRPADMRIYANRFGLLHAVLALKQGKNVRGMYPTLPKSEDALNGLAGPFDVVWFKQDSEEGYEYDHRAVAAMPGAEVLADLRDGVVLRIFGPRARPPEGSGGPLEPSAPPPERSGLPPGGFSLPLGGSSLPMGGSSLALRGSGLPPGSSPPLERAGASPPGSGPSLEDSGLPLDLCP